MANGENRTLTYRENDFSSYGDAFRLPRAAATVFHSNHFRTSITSVVSQLIESGNLNKHSINGKWPALNWHFSRQLESIYSRHTFRQPCWWIPWVGFLDGRAGDQTSDYLTFNHGSCHLLSDGRAKRTLCSIL